MYCTPILIADPCNDPAVNPAEFLAVALRAVEQPPCASHVWTVRVQTAAPDCATTESEGVAHAEALAATATQLMTHLEAPWYEAIAAREALAARAELEAAVGTPPALTPPAAEDLPAPTPPPIEAP